MENGEFTVFDKTNLSYETRLECDRDCIASTTCFCFCFDGGFFLLL